MFDNLEKSLKDAEVMIVDDTPENLHFLSKILKSKGFNTRPANTGELALASIRKKCPDIVLLDVNLPGISGYEVCRKIKSDPMIKDLPVIFISALSDVSDKLIGFESGGSDYISKPFQPSEVLARIEIHLQLYFSRQLIEDSIEQMTREIKRREDVENSLYNEKELFRMTLHSIGDGVICTDNNGKITMMNDVAKCVTGWHDQSAIGMSFDSVFNITNENTRVACESPIQRVIKFGKVIELEGHTILITKDGNEVPIADSAAPIFDSLGRQSGVVLVFRDVTNEKQKIDQIKFLSFRDHLTGLYNRRFYEEELNRLDTERNLPISLIIADINGLKLTNDAFGHASGDALLQKVAEIMKTECRSDEILARIGGDEFVILLPKTNEKDVQGLISRIQTAVSKFHNETVILSVSMGYAVKNSGSEDIKDVFKVAEDDMYRHKLTESSSVRSKTISLIMNSLFEKNPREMRHAERVSGFCKLLAESLNFSSNDIKKIGIAGLMHDIGKIGINEAILNKRGPLDNNEWGEIKRHPEIGFRILSSVNEFSEISNFILAHHEHWNGKGYPKGSKELEIPIESRIIALADAYDAMTSERTYGRKMSKTDAIDEIQKCLGEQFDPHLASVFIEKVLRKHEKVEINLT